MRTYIRFDGPGVLVVPDQSGQEQHLSPEGEMARRTATAGTAVVDGVGVKWVPSSFREERADGSCDLIGPAATLKPGNLVNVTTRNGAKAMIIGQVVKTWNPPATSSDGILSETWAKVTATFRDPKPAKPATKGATKASTKPATKVVDQSAEVAALAAQVAQLTALLMAQQSAAPAPVTTTTRKPRTTKAVTA